MKNISLILIGTLLVICSCSLEKSNKYLVLNPTGKKLSFELDSITSNLSTGLQYVNEGEPYLVNANWSTNSLQIYSFKTKKLKKNIYFPYEGPNGIDNLFGFHVKNLKEIYLFPQLIPQIIVADTSGKVNKRIDYVVPGGHRNAFIHNIYFQSPPIISDNSILVKTHLEGNLREITQKDIDNKYILYNISLNDGQVSLTGPKYPSDYMPNGMKHFDSSSTKGKSKYVFSFFGDHRVFYIDKLGEELKSKIVKSKYLDDVLPNFPLEGERLDTQKYLLTTSHYESIIYDHYRNIYYRFAYPTLNVNSEQELSDLRFASNEFVIMVLDENLNIITERYFEGGTYLPNNIFITEEGLYISINHPRSKWNEENKMSFELLSLTNNKIQENTK
jgi:hypothetical protein